MNHNEFLIEWDLHELGPKQAGLPYHHVAPRLDFSHFDYARAVAAGYVPANEPLPKDEAA